MPTLHKRENSPFWQLYWVVGGKKFRESTGIRHNGRRTPCELATAVLRGVEERLARAKYGLTPTLTPKTIAEFFEELLGSYKDHRERSQTRYGQIAKHFRLWADDNGLKLVDEVKPGIAVRYVDTYRGRLAGTTLNTQIGWLKLAWYEAKKRGYTDFEENPWTMKRVKVEASGRHAFSQSDITTLLNWVPPREDLQWMRTLIRIGLYTGARIESIKALRWENIGFDLNVINFPKTKTSAFAMALHPDLKEYLLSVRQPEGPVLGEGPLGKCDAYISITFCYWAKKLGVVGTFHWFRHTFTSRLAEHGVEKRIAMLLTNHKDEDVHEGYTHVEAAKLLPHLAAVKFA